MNLEMLGNEIVDRGDLILGHLPLFEKNAAERSPLFEYPGVHGRDEGASANEINLQSENAEKQIAIGTLAFRRRCHREGPPMSEPARDGLRNLVNTQAKLARQKIMSATFPQARYAAEHRKSVPCSRSIFKSVPARRVSWQSARSFARAKCRPKTWTGSSRIRCEGLAIRLALDIYYSTA